jgi:hypothetical protein
LHFELNLEATLNLVTAARTARAVSLGVWLGCSVMVFVAAPIVFEKLDRSKAGEVVGAILHAAALLTAGLAVVALIAEGVILAKDSTVRSWLRYLPPLALAGACVILLVLIFWIGPRIEDLREQIGQFTAANENTAERLLFRKLHGASMGLSLLQTIFVAVAFVAGLL